MKGYISTIIYIYIYIYILNISTQQITIQLFVVGNLYSFHDQFFKEPYLLLNYGPIIFSQRGLQDPRHKCTHARIHTNKPIFV